MRCECCDRILSDLEATSKFKGSGTYTNMCTTCIRSLPDDVEVVNRSDLEEDVYDEDFEEADDGDEEE
jgi:hypothetical protein